MNKHNSMIIPDRICQNNKKLFVTGKSKIVWKINFTNNLLLQLLD